MYRIWSSLGNVSYLDFPEQCIVFGFPWAMYRIWISLNCVSYLDFPEQCIVFGFP